MQSLMTILAMQTDLGATLTLSQENTSITVVMQGTLGDAVGLDGYFDIYYDGWFAGVGDIGGVILKTDGERNE